MGRARIRTNEAAAMLGCSTDTLYDRIRLDERNDLVAKKRRAWHRMSRTRYMWTPSLLEAWFDEVNTWRVSENVGTGTKSDGLDLMESRPAGPRPARRPPKLSVAKSSSASSSGGSGAQKPSRFASYLPST